MFFEWLSLSLNQAKVINETDVVKRTKQDSFRCKELNLRDNYLDIQYI